VPPDVQRCLLSNPPHESRSELSALLHELNQPLTAILSNAQAAQRHLSNTMLDRAELHDILADIVADDKRAADIMRRLGQAIKEVRTGADKADKQDVRR